jgi:hypothetical protein
MSWRNTTRSRGEHDMKTLVGVGLGALFAVATVGLAGLPWEVRHTFTTTNTKPAEAFIPGMYDCQVNDTNVHGYLIGECRNQDGSHAFFQRADGSYELIPFPEDTGLPAGCRALGIAPDSALIVGACGHVGFFYDHSDPQLIAVENATVTIVHDVNDDFVIVGKFCEGDQCWAFRWALTEEGSRRQRLAVPGAVNAAAHKIDNTGKITGTYLGTDGKYHGFTATPMR